MCDLTAMQRAINAAQATPRLPFGAVIVRRTTGETLAVGVNLTSDGPTRHAEGVVIDRCHKAHPDLDWKEVDLYATAEPCPMCQGAVEFAGIMRVYYGTSVPWLRAHGWWQLDMRATDVARSNTRTGGAVIVGGVLESECNALFETAGSLSE